MVKWYDRIGNTIEMYVNGEWIKGTVINGPRTGDGTINMETADGNKYWCGVCSGSYMKTSDSLGDLITQADKIRSMSDEELAIENLYFISECALKEGFHYTGLDGNYYKTGEDAFIANMRWLKLEVSEVEQ